MCYRDELSGWYPHKNPNIKQSTQQSLALTHGLGERENERAVMLSTDIYLSNPISPTIHTSPPASHGPAGAALLLYICQSETCRGGRGRREKEMDSWGGVTDVLWTSRSDLSKPKPDNGPASVRQLHSERRKSPILWYACDFSVFLTNSGPYLKTGSAMTEVMFSC